MFREVQHVSGGKFVDVFLELTGWKDKRLTGAQILIAYGNIEITGTCKDGEKLNLQYEFDTDFSKQVLEGLGADQYATSISIDFPTRGVILATITKFVDERILDVNWSKLKKIEDI